VGVRGAELNREATIQTEVRRWELMSTEVEVGGGVGELIAECNRRESILAKERQRELRSAYPRGRALQGVSTGPMMYD